MQPLGVPYHLLLRTLWLRVSRENTSYLHLRLTHPRDPSTPPHSLRPHHAKSARVGDPGYAHSEFAQDDNVGKAFKEATALCRGADIAAAARIGIKGANWDSSASLRTPEAASLTPD